MITLLSPAKTLDYDTPLPCDLHSQPELLEQAQILIDQLRELAPVEIARLMKLSDKLAVLNVARYAAWAMPFTPANARQALFAFKGDVYQGLDAWSLPPSALPFAQKHLRILSGLYGLLRPLDLMQPYRLEMGTRLNNCRGRDLYAFWKEAVVQSINATLAEHSADVVVNLASNEYFKSVNLSALKAPVVTPVFKDMKNGHYKIISFYAKKARGLMARYIVDQQLTEPAALKQFDYGGYGYSDSQSDERQFVFLRAAPS